MAQAAAAVALLIGFGSRPAMAQKSTTPVIDRLATVARDLNLLELCDHVQKLDWDGLIARAGLEAPELSGVRLSVRRECAINDLELGRPARGWTTQSMYDDLYVGPAMRARNGPAQLPAGH